MNPPDPVVRREQWRGAVLTVAWLFPLIWTVLWGVMAATP